jgi:hypothetical protein
MRIGNAGHDRRTVSMPTAPRNDLLEDPSALSERTACRPILMGLPCDAHQRHRVIFRSRLVPEV